VEHAWRNALADTNGSTLEQFASARPEWGQRLALPALTQAVAQDRQGVTKSLLSDLVAHTAAQPSLERRLTALKRRGDDADAASYRMQVRLAVVLRMRALLLSIAGRAYLDSVGTPGQKRRLAALTACEDLSFDAPSASASRLPEPAPIVAYPAFEQDLQLTREALPGWMGIRFQKPTPAQSKQHRLPPGASVVAYVYADSPAQAAGVEVGDVILGPPGELFTSSNQIRVWTMLSEIGQPGELVVLRAGRRQKVAIVPDPFPIQMPSLPAPVVVGAAAPPVDLQRYRGPVSLGARKRGYLLYYWATWCGPCKAAVPELLAFGKEHGVPVIAITDEDKEQLDAFVQKWAQPFPEAIAMDPLRRAFVAYGVGGTPSFVLVDERGNVAGHQVGYRKGEVLKLADR
jgi:thiol-disulfide isomerase/thioredoxin